VSRVGIDTGALLAIANPRDQYHAVAVETARQHMERGGRWIGTVLVLAELHGHLLRWRGPQIARELLAAVRRDSAYDWREVGPELLDTAISEWLEPFADQRFSLTDAVTFALMRRERITTAFAFDRDFRTAGFTLLGGPPAAPGG
jgi:predicted nucleic acid-binding protein